MRESATSQPVLHGFTVLDLTQQLPGPYATQLLVSLGARVVKVEPPGGDIARILDPVMFANVNAGKRSVVLDLKTESGRQALRRIAAVSDVLVEGFRPGVAARLGAGYADIAAIRPDIVYCSLSGYGAHGPYSAVPGHDLNYLGVAGGVPADAGDGPDYIGVPTVDMASGTMACLAIIAALMRRERSQTGAFLDVAMLDSAVYWTAVKPPQMADGLSEAAYRVVRCSDGRALSFAVLEDKFWQNLCRVLAWGDWIGDPALATHEQRRGRAAEIRSRLESTISTRPRNEWLPILWEADVPVGPVHQFEDVPTDPQVRAREIFSVDTGAAAGARLASPLPRELRSAPPGLPPALGADTRSILAEVGLKPDASVAFGRSLGRTP